MTSEDSRLLDDFEKAEQEAMQAVLERLGEAADRLEQTTGVAPKGIHKQIEDMRSRLGEAAAQYDRRVGEFHEQLVEGAATEEEFRARLVILDMEYASRLRLAEEGLRLLSQQVTEQTESNRVWSRGFLGEVADAFRAKVRPAREALAKALRGRKRPAPRVPETGPSLDRIGGELRREREARAKEAEARQRAEAQAVVAEERVRAVEADAEAAMERARAAEADAAAAEERAQAAEQEAEAAKKRALAAGAVPADLERKFEAMEEKARRLEAESARLREEADSQVQEAVSSVCEEREAVRKQLHRAERERDEAREALTRFERDLEEVRDESQAAGRQWQALEVERDAARAEAVKAERELERLGLEHARLNERFGEATAGRDSIREAVLDAKKSVKRLLVERRGLIDRLHAAERSSGLGGEAGLEKRIEEREAEILKLRREINELQERQTSLEESLREAGEDREQAKETAQIALEKLAAAKEAESRMQKGLLKADVARDRSIDQSREQWAKDKAELEDTLQQKTRDLNTLTSNLEASERSWQDTLARQDAERMKEIFKLKSEVERLKRTLQERNEK